MTTNEPWQERLLREALISRRALQHFARLNPQVPWRETADVLRRRIAHGHPRRRAHQKRIELITGATVPLDYLEVVLRGRQVAVIRKDKLGQNHVSSVRSIGRVRNADPAWRPRRALGERAA